MAESQSAKTNVKAGKSGVVSGTALKKYTLVSDEPRNFLATFLLTTVFAPLGLRHFYLGDIRFGWIRSGLFIGGIVWMILFSSFGVLSLVVLGWLATMVAFIWGIVDFFYVYFNVRHDIRGRSLVATSLDRKFTTVIFWVTIALAAVGLIASLIGLSVGQSTFDSWSNDLYSNNTQQRSSGDGQYY